MNFWHGDHPDQMERPNGCSIFESRSFGGGGGGHLTNFHVLGSVTNNCGASCALRFGLEHGVSTRF